MITLRAAGIFSAAIILSASPALAQRATHTCDTSLRAVANPTLSKTNACVVKRGNVVLETAYYQNASRVGGSALAAYPDARLRFGVASNIEGFFDAPTEIAKSGLDGRGIYTMAPSGFGLKTQLAQVSGIVYSLVAEVRPPLDVMAPMTLRPLTDLALTGGWTSPSQLALNVQVGALKYRQGALRVTDTTDTVATSLSALLWTKTSLTAQLQTFSKPAAGASAQTLGTLGLSRELNTDALFNVELGTAFNPIRQTKAHYLGAGFTVR